MCSFLFESLFSLVGNYSRFYCSAKRSAKSMWSSLTKQIIFLNFMNQFKIRFFAGCIIDLNSLNWTIFYSHQIKALSWAVEALKQVKMAPKEKVEIQRENRENLIRPTGILNENDAETVDGALLKPEGRIAKLRGYNLVWRNIILMSALHVMALYGGWRLLSGQTKWQTLLFGNWNLYKHLELVH